MAPTYTPPKSGGGGKKKSGGGSGGGGGGSGGGGRSSGGGRTAAQRHAERSAKSKGSETYPGVNVFGQPITRADFLRARQHYNDLFRAHLGRGASRKEVERILRRGISDYQLRINLMKRPAFRKSPMFRSLNQQVNALTGTSLGAKTTANVLRRAARAEGGINEASIRAALLSNVTATKAVTSSLRQTSGADIDYLSGSFGQGQLNPAQYRALALQQSGLRQSTLGAKLQGALERAQRASERVFSGTLASPSLSLGAGGLQAPSLNPRQEPDIQA